MRTCSSTPFHLSLFQRLPRSGASAMCFGLDGVRVLTFQQNGRAKRPVEIKWNLSEWLMNHPKSVCFFCRKSMSCCKSVYLDVLAIVVNTRCSVEPRITLALPLVTTLGLRLWGRLYGRLFPDFSSGTNEEVISCHLWSTRTKSHQFCAKFTLCSNLIVRYKTNDFSLSSSSFSESFHHVLKPLCFTISYGILAITWHPMAVPMARGPLCGLRLAVGRQCGPRAAQLSGGAGWLLASDWWMASLNLICWIDVDFDDWFLSDVLMIVWWLFDVVVIKSTVEQRHSTYGNIGPENNNQLDIAEVLFPYIVYIIPDEPGFASVWFLFPIVKWKAS